MKFTVKRKHSLSAQYLKRTESTPDSVLLSFRSSTSLSYSNILILIASARFCERKSAKIPSELHSSPALNFYSLGFFRYSPGVIPYAFLNVLIKCSGVSYPTSSQMAGILRVVSRRARQAWFSLISRMI